MKGHVTMSGYEVRLLTSEEYEEWDSLIATAPAGSVFNSSTWLDTVARLFNRETRIWGVYHKEQLVGGIGLNLFKPYPMMKIVGFLPLTPYTSIVIQPCNSDKEARNAYHRLGVLDSLAAALEGAADVVCIANHPSLLDVRPFTWRGWNSEVHYTYLLDIAEPTLLWDRVDRDIRNKVRKCRKRGVEIRRTTDARVLHRLLCQTYEKQERRVYVDEPSFCELCDVLSAEGRLETFVAQVGDLDISACSIVKDYRGLVHGWLAGTDPDYLSLGVSSFAIWTIIEELATHGYRCFDLDGANTPSIARFKSQLDGTLTPYYVLKSQNLKSQLFDWGWQKVQALGVADRLKQKLLNPGRV